MPLKPGDHRRSTSFTITKTAHALLTLLAEQRDTTRTRILEELIRRGAAQEGLWRELAAHRPQKGESHGRL
jgi:hypothetical protein